MADSACAVIGYINMVNQKNPATNSWYSKLIML
jgi:hypothetical protein